MLPVKPVTVREGRGDTSALSNQSLNLPGKWNEVQVQKRDAEFLLPVGTAWVSRDVHGVADQIYRMTGGKCKVASCQCGKCISAGHFPHVVLELTKHGHTAPVFGFTSFGPHVIQRMQEIHISNKPNQKSMERNKKLLDAKKKLAVEVQQEKLEVVQAALTSHKFDWRGPNGIRTKAY
jgi:hypothetical protein